MEAFVAQYWSAATNQTLNKTLNSPQRECIWEKSAVKELYDYKPWEKACDHCTVKHFMETSRLKGTV